ncbi:MAG: prolyl oligopeptidase family serine peptidase [Ginsengibacter sp.]
MLKFIAYFFLFIPAVCIAQQKNNSSLTIEHIMSDPKWIGTSPSNPVWADDGQTLYFNWNPDKAPEDSLYFITTKNRVPQKASIAQKQNMIRASSLNYNKNRTAYVYSQNGDIFYHEIKPGKTQQITNTVESESNPDFSFNDKRIIYLSGQNIYSWNLATGEISQLTNYQTSDGGRESRTAKLPEQEQWLKNDQLSYMEILKERNEKREETKKYNNDLPKRKELRKLVTGGNRVMRQSLSADGRYVSYSILKPATNRKTTIIPDYVTESGYTTDIPGRTKVGEELAKSEFYVYDTQTDTVYSIKTDSIEGIRDLPDYVKDYPIQLKDRTKKNEARAVNFMQASWSPNGENLVLDLRSQDNKDRWIMLWNPATNKLELLDRQRNEAWIGGPGLFNLGWIDDSNLFYQSEKTGYSHLYTINVKNREKKALTSGNYEVQTAKLSLDKKYFFITTNEVHPGEKQFYRLRISDNKIDRITKMTGGNEVTISPDEKTIAFLYSYSNKPTELYVQSINPGSKADQITHLAQSAEFKSYPWRDPEVITFKARDGAEVYGRVYKPTNAKPGMPAVVFVHGAGYLQNAHKWWSSYFREFMFHNFLADNGYYVIDIDYRGSAGYGADWRTGIYRHMGGKDLTDNVDAAGYLVKTYGVDAKKIGIYGGSYGGFITLMAMFTTPDVFAAGAGLRSVTDWANYNHGYTANILNEPFNDSLAYRRSSPIYYAEGLKGHLLMCHGMVDVNVNFQDIVKLSQRLIELKKDNWELAVYPMEDHGFVEPTSWMDEYKRIYKLYETSLK